MEKTGLERLEETIGAYPSVLVSLSGGVDSSLVAAAASRAKGRDAVALTLTGPSLPARDLRMARKVAQAVGIAHIEMPMDPLSDPKYAGNPSNRCYFCRKMEGRRLVGAARELGMTVIADGVHLDDLGAGRPGIRAMDEWGLKHPLVEARLGKMEVRLVARELDLPNHDEPAGACLSSRIAYGEIITAEKLNMVDRAEDYLASLGFRMVRVRLRHGVASVEVSPDDIPRLSERGLWNDVLQQLAAFGLGVVLPEPQEYRKGGVS